jgi:DNA-binding transcriptional ArsR family regulator
MKTSPEQDDVRVWRALADPSRRRILDLLRERSRTTGELCGEFELSRFGVMKHLGILERAGLVTVERRGRERFNHLNVVPIQQIYRRWIRPFEAIPADRMLKIKALAESEEEK